MLTLIIFGLCLVAYVLRSVPHWLSPQGLGVDHWFWKTYIETYRRDRQFPPVLPQYIFDEAQWYPPLFPMLMARLPAALFDSGSHQIAIVIDLLRMLLLLGVAGWQSNGDATVILIAGLVYATTPIQISYNIQLNPRAVGALMLDALLLTFLWSVQPATPWWGWGIVGLLGGLILLTHKMTTQLFWFLMLATGLLYRKWEVLILIPASIAVAMALSKGFYRNVLIAHWDIVTFWNRNWRWLGADPIRESPIYGDGKYERAEKLHKVGARGFLWHCFILFGFNPAAWIGCLLVYERLFAKSPFLIYPTYLLVWLLLSCLFACLTMFVPKLKCLGAGYLYVYNTSLLCSLLLALTFKYTTSPRFSVSFVILALVLNICGVMVYYWEARRNKRTRVEEGLGRIIDILALRPKGVVMCIPVSWHEIVAYKTNHQVLWGAHGHGFKRIEPTLPRLMLPMSEIRRRYNVRYLLTMDEMLPPNFEAELTAATEVRDGVFRLYSFEPAD